MKLSKVFVPIALAAFLNLAPNVFAVVIVDFEGIAPGPPGSCSMPPCQTTEDPSRGLGVNPQTFNGFDVFTAHGHYQPFDLGLIQSGQRPDNGTDWFLHDHSRTSTGVDFGANQPLVITRSDGGAFSLLSIDASEWDAGLPFHQTLSLTGHFASGGTTTAEWTTDSVFGFETFLVSGFTDIVQLDIIGSSSPGVGPCVGFAVCGTLGYDNITFWVPEPATPVILGIGLLLIRFFAFPRRSSSTSMK